MITTILIDIDDTLFDFNLCAKWAMDESAKQLNLKLPEGAYDCFKTINASLWKKLERKEIAQDGVYGVRWWMISKELGVDFDGDKFEDHFLENLSRSTVEVDGAYELMEYLSAKYKVYAATNGPFDQQIQRMQLADMDKFLSGYFISEKIGYSKPAKEFFDACYEELNPSSPDEIMMIGDSLTADINGALDYGFKTCWFDKNQKGTENSADYVVTRLQEIKDIL